MERISQLIIDFIEKSIDMGIIDAVDRLYKQNQLLQLFELDELVTLPPSQLLPDNRLSILDQLVQYAIESKLINNRETEIDVFSAKIMDVTTPLPSVVNHTFWHKHTEHPNKATDYFYTLSQQTNYIKTREIAQNIDFKHHTEYGELEMTINLSKPEKTTEEIKLAQKATSQYPVNQLCIENEGYKGHVAHPGRSNHRVIRLALGDDQWGFQYSPYSYYKEHSIFFSVAHRPMNVGIDTISRLMMILEYLPHYFVGSNAGLPIVGGSILSHDHYQGGFYTFPLDKQEIIYKTVLEGLDVQVGIVKWPMSVIRLQTADKQQMMLGASRVIEAWKDYNNPELDIISSTDEVLHNAITPILRRQEDQFVLDLVLRNNRTSERYPDGIFHPHPDVQHIKRENIGLIEVLGLAILPPRLKEEIADIQQYLLDKAPYSAVVETHKTWAREMKNRYQQTLTPDNVTDIIYAEIGDKFLRVLMDAGVFKTDSVGQSAFRAFVDQL